MHYRSCEIVVNELRNSTLRPATGCMFFHVLQNSYWRHTVIRTVAHLIEDIWNFDLLMYPKLSWSC